MNASGDKDEQRRAWLEAVNHIFRIRAHKKQAYEKRSKKKGSYDSLVGAHESGKITEGILVVRNIATHVLTERANPESKMPYPSEKLFPSDYLFPGNGNLFWLDMHELSPGAVKEISRRNARNYYRDKVAGFLVLDTLVAAQNFLIDDVSNSFA
ncbi:MAG: hypothetical protein ACRDTH_28515 [Pseudonocardiaceae bacterium]